MTGSVFGGPAHAVSFNKIFYDTVSYRVALKGICFQPQMVVRARAEILMVDNSLSRMCMSRCDYLPFDKQYTTPGILFLH